MFRKIKVYFMFVLVLVFISNIILVDPIIAHDDHNEHDEDSIIIDNTDQYFSKSGNNFWSSSTYISGYYGSDYYYSSWNYSAWAKWKPHLTQSGEYEIFMRWTSGVDRPDAAPVEVHYKESSVYSTTINQKKNGGQWVSLGTFELQQGSSNYVKISCSDYGYTIADAVKFVYKGQEEQNNQDLTVKMYNATQTDVINSINPKFEIKNTGNEDIDLEDIKIRYYYTVDIEDNQEFLCDWSSIKSSNVTGSFHRMSEFMNGSNYYLEIGFKDGSGTLESGKSVYIHSRINKEDWSNYSQSDDYSFNSSYNEYVEWDKVTGYIHDDLIWGSAPDEELTPMPDSYDLVVEEYNDIRTQNANTIEPFIKFYNSGTQIINLKDVTLRYYFDANPQKTQQFVCDWSAIGTAENREITTKVNGTFVSLDNEDDSANCYLEISFDDDTGTLGIGNSVKIQLRIHTSDWADYDQYDHYSFNLDAEDYIEWENVTGYIDGQLVWGAEPDDSDSTSPTHSTLEVLEIQPDNSFELTEDMLGTDANITTMSMAEFIGKIDEINGKYDIVYVGNKLQDGSGYYAIGRAASSLPQGGNNGTDSLEYYSANDITTRSAEKIKDFISTGQLTIFDDSIFTTSSLNDTKLYSSFIEYRNNDDYPNFVTAASSASKESNYNVNGFTGKYYDRSWYQSRGVWKYEEILKYQRNETSIDYDWGYGSPDSGYQSGLGSDEFTIVWTGTFHADNSGEYQFTTTTDDGVRLWIDDDKIIDAWYNQIATKHTAGVNLEGGHDYTLKMEYYENTGSASAKLSWTIPAGSTASINESVQNYLDGQYARRPELTIVDKPVDYTGLDGTYQEDTLLAFGFDADNPNTAGNGKMTAKLYIDINGDGTFKDEELFSTLDNISSGTGFPINYRVSDLFTGLLPWKIELLDKESGAKAYKTGYTALRGEAVNVRVLQLYPDSNNLGLDSLGDLLSKDGEFNIEITKMHVNDFDKNYPNPVNGKPTILNGNYDMIVLGFSDMYENGQIWNVDAVNAIKDFISTGQSVMFTHDTLTYDVDDTDWGASFTKYFRDLIGQNIYNKDPLNPDAVPSHNNRLDFPDPKKNSYGFTTKALDIAVSDSLSKTTTGYKLNDGLLTTYPYILGDISIAETHHQYFQLDLEDPDVIPWYTLKGDDFNELDGRNEYYTYTKGNITFSGTGHSVPSGTDEQKLFVNTMIKATRGANHAPVLNIFGLSDGMDILHSQDSIDFSFTVEDIDLNDEYFNAYVYIYIDKNNDGEYSDDEKELVYSSTDNSIMIDELQEISVPKNVAADYDTFKLELVVSDKNGAMTSKYFNLNHKNEPKLELGFDGFTKGYLVGDTANVNIDVIPKTADIDARFENVTLSTVLSDDDFDVDYSGIWSTDSDGLYTTNLDDIEFEDGNSPSTQTRKLTVEFKKAKSYTISNTISYDKYYLSSGEWVSQGDESESSTYSFNVKSGTIDVSVVDNRGRSLKNVPVTVKDSAGAVIYTGNTNNTGSFAVTGLKTDLYTISVGELEGYEILDNEKSTALSYTVPSQDIVFEFSGDPVGDIGLSDTDGNNTVEIYRFNGEVIDTQNTVQLREAFKLYRPVNSVKFKLSGVEGSLSYGESCILKNGNGETVGTFTAGSGSGSNVFTYNGEIPIGQYYVYIDIIVADGITGEEKVTLEEIKLLDDDIVGDDDGYTTYTIAEYGSLFTDNEVEFDVEDISVPTKPANLAAAVDDTSVLLTWDESVGSVSYILQRREIGETEFTTIYSGTNISFTDNAVENGKSYEYIVIGINGDLQSEQSDIAVANIRPTPPKDLSVSMDYEAYESGDSKVIYPIANLTWIEPDCNVPSSGFSYNIYRIEITEDNYYQSINSLASYTLVASGLTDTDYTDDLTGFEGKIFHYVVTALNVDAESDWTDFYNYSDDADDNGIVVVPDVSGGLPLSMDSKVGTQTEDEYFDENEIRFLSGDYVPVDISFTPNVTIKDPVIYIDLALRDPDDDYEIVDDYSIELTEGRITAARYIDYVEDTEDPPAIYYLTDDDGNEIKNKLKVEGIFNAGEEIKIEYLVQVVPEGQNIDYDANKIYNLTFSIVEVYVGTSIVEGEVIYGKHSSPSIDSDAYSDDSFTAELIIVDPKILR